MESTFMGIEVSFLLEILKWLITPLIICSAVGLRFERHWDAMCGLAFRRAGFWERVFWVLTVLLIIFWTVIYLSINNYF